jgi:hypothetical protein
MPSVAESEIAGTPLNSVLDAGLMMLSANQTIEFIPYARLVLPMDGFVFWVRADLLSPSALFNSGAFNEVTYDLPRTASGAPASISVKGSLHVSVDLTQSEDETLALNHVIFTTSEQIRALDEINPEELFIGQFRGIQFAFSRQGNFYEQAGLYHYVGDAINGAMAAQIINDLNTFDTHNRVVSNSLPLWLTLNSLMPVYPSFLVPPNILAPYAAVHIEPSSTQAIQSAPYISGTGTHTQLVQERVKFTLYGVRNDAALDFQDMIFQYSLDTDSIGIMNTPVIRDEKRGQRELSAIAMKKTFELDVNYYQSRVQDISRQFILSAIPKIYID